MEFRHRSSPLFPWILIGWIGLAAGGVAAAQPQAPKEPFASLVRTDERLQPREALAPLADARGRLSADMEGAWNRFLLDHGEWSAYVDARNGRVESAEGPGIPWTSGAGDRRTEPNLAALEAMARKFVAANPALFGIPDRELRLSPGRSGKVSDSLWLVDFDVVRGELTVEGARIVFRVGQGNLIQLGSELLPPADAAAPPVKVSREAAYETVAKYVGGFEPTDQMLDRGSLHLLPLALRDDRFDEGFEFARGYGLATVWEISFRRDGFPATWRARVDATTGEIREFIDTNLDAQATGGVGADSSLSSEIMRQMPFTDLTGGTYTNSAGVFTYSGTPLTTTMNGQYVRVNDTCGSISLTTDPLGNLQFGTATGNNCATPGVGGAGNTRSSRTSFYHLNRGKEIVRGWLPGSSGWLNSQLTTNVNLTSTCNGFWNGSTIQLYQAIPGLCGASGEKPGFILHEFGHGVDANDGNGLDTSSSEAYADVVAALTLHNSCVAPGFRLGNCGNAGYGDPCTSCTGLRDLDWAKHSLGAAHTVANYTELKCPTGTTSGPCGREAHCEASVPTEAVWDFANRDLPSPGGGAA
ncbi:MAG TPA: hypothetical protein VN851_11050 [Thermoanaerobaculia bacterium]|nr:hypothetical protein [Thermoanaerobaculia bacterium]